MMISRVFKLHVEKINTSQTFSQKYNLEIPKVLISLVYIDVGDQKFISLNSDGFGTKIRDFLLPLETSSQLGGFEDVLIESCSSSTIDVCERACLFDNKFDQIQLLWFSVSTKGAVKYLLILRVLFGEEDGEPSGDAGRDLLPRLKVGLKPSGALSQSFDFCMLKPRIDLPETIC